MDFNEKRVLTILCLKKFQKIVTELINRTHNHFISLSRYKTSCKIAKTAQPETSAHFDSKICTEREDKRKYVYLQNLSSPSTIFGRRPIGKSQ